MERADSLLGVGRKRETMAAPLVHILTATIKEGQLEGFKKFAQEHAEFAEAKHPSLLAFHLYVNEDDNKMSVVEVHPDSDSMEFYMQEVVVPRRIQAYEYLEEGSEIQEIYGEPSEPILDWLRQHGVSFTVKTHHVGGFTRLRAGQGDERPMSAEENKEKVRRLIEEVFEEGKAEVIDELLDPDFVVYDPNSETGEVRGMETLKWQSAYFHSAMPDLAYTIMDLVAEGDKVVARLKMSGTHQGEFFGMPGTGKRLEMSAIQIIRFDESGKMVEEWTEYDMLGALR